MPILGICGGYQMLGAQIHDPHGIEGEAAGSHDGLGLLRAASRFDAYEKRTVQVEGTMVGGGEIRGYEIHMGATESEEEPLFILRTKDGTREEGSVSEDGMVMGTYVHGLFDLPSFRNKFLSLAGKGVEDEGAMDHESAVEAALDKVARTVAQHVDVDAITGSWRRGHEHHGARRHLRGKTTIAAMLCRHFALKGMRTSVQGPRTSPSTPT